MFCFFFFLFFFFLLSIHSKYKQLFSLLATKCEALACLNNHLSISHILSPCQGRKLTRFDSTLLSDQSVIGVVHLSAAAPNALWVFFRHDPISPYLSSLHSKLTNNTRISYCVYLHSSTFMALLLSALHLPHRRTRAHTHSSTNRLRPPSESCGL